METEMRYIYEVSRTGSFSKAAENLYVSQPALSKSIKKTEDAIGMPLFDRRAHPLQLTEAGQAYLKAIEKILLAEKDLSDQIRDIRDLEKGQISIGGSNYVNTSILPDVLTSFQERYPGVQIRLVEFSSARLSQMLAKNELDLTFSCNMEFMQDFKKQEAFRDRLLMAVPWNAPINETLGDRSYGVEEIIQGDHLRMKKPPVEISAFRGLPFIALDQGNNLYDRALQIFREAGFDPEIRIVLQQMTTAFKLAESGFGITMTCDRLVRASYTDLRFYAIDSPLADRIFYMLLPRRAYVPVAVQRFMEHFKSRI